MTQLSQATKIRLAAYLHCKEHLTEQQIGWRLGGITQGTVSKLLKKAVAEGLIKQCATFQGLLAGSDDVLLDSLQFQSALHDRIMAHLKYAGCENPPKVYLYDLRADGAMDVPLESRREAFAGCVAPELRALLTRPSVKNIGVAWGGMIATAVAEMARRAGVLPSGEPVTVMAMCGEPLNDRPTKESSSAIAEHLSEVLNGDRRHARTLGITPAYLPARSHASGAEWIWRYIVASKPYVEVFGTSRLPPDTRAHVPEPDEPLCDRMDAFLTSVSIEGGSAGYGPGKLYPADIITPEELDNVAFGDLGGIPLPRPQLDESQQGILKRVRESWTGITREQLEQCVARGYSGHPTSRPPGCILLASGALKARTVYQAVIRERLVNHLFIDYDCAAELDRFLTAGE